MVAVAFVQYVKSENSCGSDIESVTVTINAPAPVLTIVNPSATCGSVDITTSSVITGNTNGGTLSYWTNATATTSLTTPTAVTASGTYYVKSTNTCGNDIQPVTVTINPPAPVLTIVNPSAACGSVNITTSSVITGNTNGGTLSYWTNATATTSLTTPTAVTASGTYYIKSTNTCGFDIEPVTVIVNPLPSAAGTISGSPTVNQGQTSVAYSVPAIANATSYIWAYSGSGATFSNTTASITINFASNATTGYLTVLGRNACGDGTVSQQFLITVNTSVAATIWNGLGWSNGTPTATKDAIINGNYTGAGFTAKSLTVNAGKIFNPSGKVKVINNFANAGTTIVQGNGELNLQGTNTNTGTERLITTRVKANWSYISSPIMPFAVQNTFSTDYLYRYNEASPDPATTYVNLATGQNTVSGQGMLLWAVTTGTKTFTGKYNQGTVNFPLTNTVGSADQGWNLAGNPYPASIYWTAVYADNSFLDPIYKVWGSGGFISYNALDGTGAGSNVSLPTGVLFVNTP